VHPFIETRNLEHVYRLESGREIAALRGVDLTIDRGEFVALIGANGSGKSTLARHFNALLLPTSGAVRVDGLSTADPRTLWEVRGRVGMVFQNPENQLVASTVEEDVAFGPENWGLPPAEIRARVDAALKFVGLESDRNTPPQMLSGGQKQLVAIAGALAGAVVGASPARPTSIVFDEPTSMLDPRGRRQVMGTIQRLNAEEGLTVILITQSMEEAAAADRVLVMHAGEIAMDGPPREVFDKDEQLEVFGLGIPPVAEIARSLRRRDVPLRPGLLTIEALTHALSTSPSREADPC
jgi:energy-coupling factor transport system ATP-binding protein